MTNRDTGGGPRRPDYSMETLSSPCLGTRGMNSPFGIHLSLPRGGGGAGHVTPRCQHPHFRDSHLSQKLPTSPPQAQMSSCVAGISVSKFHCTPSSSSPSPLPDHSLHPAPVVLQALRGPPDTLLSLLLFTHSSLQASLPVLPAPSMGLHSHPESRP